MGINRLHLLTALAAAALLTTAFHSGQRAAAFEPPSPSAPPMQNVTRPAEKSQRSLPSSLQPTVAVAAQMPSAKVPLAAAAPPKADPVAELLASFQKEHQL